MPKFQNALFLFLTIGIFSPSFAQNQIPTVKEIDKIIMSRPADFESLSAPDSNGIRHPLLMPNDNKSTNVYATPQIPYPIIFIHGLNSTSNTWNSFANDLINNYGFQFGGRFDFSLNADGNNYAANLDFRSSSFPNGDLAFFTGT